MTRSALYSLAASDEAAAAGARWDAFKREFYEQNLRAYRWATEDYQARVRASKEQHRARRHRRRV